ncbi:DinB family protein [Leptolyngbya sp. AN02str]|uniref:DinB family protein n=1 Tax=Leptolyngbya sp. AN02str TaxID=3423363 RepID=UPI003D3213D9
MINQAYCQLMATYNEWMNHKLYAICATLSEGDRTRDLGAFFHSIHGTLNHLLHGDRIWLGRFTNARTSLPPIGHILYADFAELQHEREQTDRDLLNWAASISEAWLEKPFEYTSAIDSETRVLPAWVLVTHLFNHQTHHRGQLTTLLHQLGHDPGVTDVPWLPGLDTWAK